MKRHVCQAINTIECWHAWNASMHDTAFDSAFIISLTGEEARVKSVFDRSKHLIVMLGCTANIDFIDVTMQ